MNKVVEERTKRTQWYQEARFGMFIHWGLYAIPARGEWLRSTEQLTREEYEPFKDEFTTENYNPKEWARMAKEAGMKYAVLTAKHHDGFCLFDSKLTDFKSTNAPCGRDLVREFLEAFREDAFLLLKSGNDTRSRAEKLCHDCGHFAPRIKLEPEQQITAYNLSRYGMGISFNGDILIRHMPDDHRLIYYKLPYPDAVRNVNFYYKQNRYMTRVVVEFLKLV